MKRIIYLFLASLLLFHHNILASNNSEPQITVPQEEHTVKGKVISGTDNLTLPGVNIVEKGTMNGTVTDFDGNFTIKVSSPNAVLKFSSIGFAQMEVEINGRTSIDVVMEENIEKLEEVVVVGYGIQKKADVTGAISTIKTEELTSIPVTNVATAMQGRASGVQVVQNSGSPGADVSIKIRGTGTINNSDPLYVVDGFITEDINFLNPDDVQDIQILKDASSSAIYGARAANGVIIVTTKKGKEGKLKINFNTYWGTSDFWNQPEIMDKYQYLDLYQASHGGQQLLASARDTLLFNDYAAENLMDHISQKGMVSKYNLQVSGGTDKTKYIISGLYSSEDGIIKKSDQVKTSFRLGIETKLTDYMKLNLNSIFTNSTRGIVTEGGDNIFQYALSTEPHLTLQPETAFNWKGNELVSVDEALSWNPYTRLWYADMNESTNQFVNNLELAINLGKSFIFTTRAGLDNLYQTNTDFRKRSDPAIYVYYDDIKYDDNTYQERHEKRTKWQVENILSYNKSINEHNVNLVTAFALEGYNREYIIARKAMAPGYDPEFQSLDAAYLSPTNSGSETSWTSVGIPFRIDYNYKHKYFFQFNFRADASSIFSEGNRWGYFPSVSTGWTLTEESFLQETDWLTHLKIRANWGASGNNRIDEYASYTLISTSNNFYAYGRNTLYKPGWSASGMGNPDILWEKTSAGNLGIDFGLFEYSVSGSFDAFLRKTSNMLLKLPMVLSSGMSGSEPWQNAGEVTNNGFEITLGWKKKIQKFEFDINGNFTKINNKVTKLGDEGNPVWGGYLSNADLNSYTTYTAVGQPIGMFYGWKIDKTKYDNGIWHEQDRENISLKPVPSEYTVPGDFMFMDLNSDNKIDENDKTYIGNPHPDFMYGLNMAFRYSGFELTIFFQGVQGNEIFNVQRYNFYGYHGSNNAVQGLIENSYTTNNESAPYPRLTNTIDYNRNYRVSDFYVEDGSYLRLKNLQFAYTFPKNLVEKIKLGNLKAYIGGYNLITITGYTGFDPEIGNESNTFMGIDRGAYPQARTFMAGIIMDI
ncbi:MAG TPA: TonB-dependent receptor [Draconibacterium sp.]|nr:TonB-dependent receptor [Draconibacterium sp.]